MKVLFLRHGAAEDLRPSSGSDMLRELTPEGRKKARNAFCMLAKVYSPPDVILTSEAVRARQTAQILSECFENAPLVETELLNPGARPAAFRKALEKHAKGHSMVAVVGHEPDISRMLAETVAEGRLRVAVKKAGCAEVDINSLGKGELQMLVTAGFLQELGG